MPEENVKTTLQFQTDITEFKAAMQEAERAIKIANSEFKAASAGMDDWAGSTDGLAAKIKQLDSLQQAHKKKLDLLRDSYAKVAAEQGENSKEAQELLIKINNQQAAFNKAEKEYRNFSAKLDDVQKAADGAGDDIKKAGDAAEEAGKDAEESAGGWSIIKDVIADFVSNAISSAIDALTSVAEATRDYRREMALMEENAKKSGVNMDTMKDTLANVAAVTGDSEAAMEGLNMLLATGMDTDNLTFAAEAMAGAAAKFDGVNFEGIAEGLQETLATGSAVGPFAEIIERSGGDLEKFNEGMAKCTTEAERQQYALQWLNDSGLKDVHDSYVQNNADLVAAEKAQFRYNDALAKVGAAVEPINTKLTEIGTTILEKVAPIVENIVQWVLDNLPTIVPIVEGIAVALGVLAAALGIQKLIEGVTTAFGFLNTVMAANPMMKWVALSALVVGAITTPWNDCEWFRDLVTGLWDFIKNLFNGVIEWLGNVAQGFVNFFANAWEGIKSAWSGAGEFFGDIWNGITSIFSNVGNWFSEKFSSAKDLVQNAWSGVTNFFSNVRQGINNAFSNVGNWFKEKFTAAKDLAQKAWSGVKDFFGNVKNGITNAFSSVDKWMGDKFGDAWTEAKKKFASSTVGQYFSQIGSSIKGVFSAVKSALSGNFSDAWESIKGVFSGWGSFFSGLWDKVKSAFGNAGSSMLEVGKNIVQGIWNGISNAFTWIKDKITGWVGNVLDFIKGLFGIHSPSTVMRDQVGKMLGLGMAEGITDSKKAVHTAMRGLNEEVTGSPARGSSGATGGTVGGKTIIFNQTNNSPRALSRREIYRQTHNALAFAGGA